MTMAFDTLKAMKRLTATGVEEAQAEAIIETVGGAMTESLATKDDLALLKADLTAEIAVVRTEIESLRTEIAKGQTTQLRWTVGSMVAIAGVIVSTLLLGT